MASDVAARGLDVRGVDCVIHYQLPASADTYIHRSGRTGRAEAAGAASGVHGSAAVRLGMTAEAWGAGHSAARASHHSGQISSWTSALTRSAPCAAAGISIALVTPQEAQRFLALTRVLARPPPPTFPLDLSLMKEVHRRVGLALKVGGGAELMLGLGWAWC